MRLRRELGTVKMIVIAPAQRQHTYVCVMLVMEVNRTAQMPGCGKSRGPLKYSNLMAQSQVLEFQSRARAEERM